MLKTLPAAFRSSAAAPTSLLLAGCVGLTALLSPVQRELRAQGSEASMFVSVLDRDGAPVPGLGTADFVIEEDENEREVVQVRPATAPMQIAVLVDTSTASAPATRDIRNGLERLVEGLHEGNEMALVSFGGPPRILVESTGRADRLRDGIGMIFGMSDSAAYLLDAMVETSHGFERREAARPVIIAITTEGVDYSNRDAQQAIDALHASGTAAHMVVLQGRLNQARSTEPTQFYAMRERDMFLDLGPRRSGGQRLEVLHSPVLDDTLDELVAVLKNQYEVVYARPASLIPPEEIRVRVRRDGLSARGTPVTRKGG